MVEDRAPPRDGRPSAAPPSEATRSGDPSKVIPAPLLLGYFDLAVRGTQEYERFARVYLSPWWEIENVPEGTRAWKRAVLERIPLRGAQHWGHLYLVVQHEPRARSVLNIFSRPMIGSPVGTKPNETRLQLRDGLQRAELIAQPRTTGTAESLGAFAREIEIRFRRQMD